MAIPTMAATGAATSPMARSLSFDRRTSALTVSRSRSGGTSLAAPASSSGLTMEYLRRSHRVIWGASSSPELAECPLGGTAEGYSPSDNPLLPADYGGVNSAAGHAPEPVARVLSEGSDARLI